MRDLAIVLTASISVLMGGCSSNDSGEPGEVTRQATVSPEAGPTEAINEEAPTVRVSRGDSLGDQACRNPSCGRVVITTSGFADERTTCDLFDDVDGLWATKTVDTNASVETSAYFGYADRQVWAVCEGGPAGVPQRYDWPDS